MLMNIQIREASEADLKVIQQLAYDIWPETYSPILSQEQIRYMLELFYSLKALHTEYHKEGYHFFIMRIGSIDAGYACVERKDAAHWHLHKIYLHQRYQGQGIGKKLIQHVEHVASQNGARYMTLNVNRYNIARYFYEACGYSIIKEDDIPIGNDFWMNDYIMRKDFTPE